MGLGDVLQIVGAIGGFIATLVVLPVLASILKELAEDQLRKRLPSFFGNIQIIDIELGTHEGDPLLTFSFDNASKEERTLTIDGVDAHVRMIKSRGVGGWFPRRTRREHVEFNATEVQIRPDVHSSGHIVALQPLMERLQLGGRLLRLRIEVRVHNRRPLHSRWNLLVMPPRGGPQAEDT